MEILVDDRPYSSECGNDQTVAELASEVCQNQPAGQERLVVRLCCDGQAVSDDELESILKKQTQEFERLELHTQPIGSLIKATLGQTIGLFEQAGATRHEAADLLSQGEQKAAMEKLRTFFDGWKQVQDSMLLSAQAMRVDLETMEVEGLKLIDILGIVKNQLNELKNGMENGDMVVVADILRYEFDEAFGHWDAFLRKLQEKAEQQF